MSYKIYNRNFGKNKINWTIFPPNFGKTTENLYIEWISYSSSLLLLIKDSWHPTHIQISDHKSNYWNNFVYKISKVPVILILCHPKLGSNIYLIEL